MTPKQELIAHLKERHGVSAPRGTHAQLIQGHKINHSLSLPHTHRNNAFAQGGEIIEYQIYLSPPKNPSASRNGDRNWVLTLASKGAGWRWELAGTWEGDPQGAITAANTRLGWIANWVLNDTGHGYHHKEKATK
jgi:hypothetical protein